MKLRICIALVALAAVCWASSASGQPAPQPGDIPAPVVDAADVFEDGLLSAEIVAPDTIQAGSVLILDVTGTSDGETTLGFVPSVPRQAVQYDTGGELIYVWVALPGSYVAIWSVQSGRHGKVALAEFAVIAGEPPDDEPDDPDEPEDPPPGDTALVKFARELAAKVEAGNHDEIAAVFRGIANRIDADELQGSKAIQTATLLALFGSQTAVNKQWVTFYNSIIRNLLNVRRLATQRQWASAFRDVAKGVES